MKSAAVRIHSSPCGLLHHPDLSRKGNGGKKKSKNEIKWLYAKVKFTAGQGRTVIRSKLKILQGVSRTQETM